jgi:hypothetical protein
MSLSVLKDDLGIMFPYIILLKKSQLDLQHLFKLLHILTKIKIKYVLCDGQIFSMINHQILWN